MRERGDYTLTPIGVVARGVATRAAAPKQGAEGAPDAWIAIDPRFAAGLDGLEAGQDVLVLTWLHEGRRDTLRVRPRDDAARPEVGVFATRSEDRPNPIGVHRVEVLAVRDGGLHVRPLEAIVGTPVVDLKPVLLGWSN